MTTVQELEAFIDQIIDRKEQVLGEIYMIRNKSSGKAYIGQTLSHRLNHGRYRPYGHIRRFKSHISEALINAKSMQCRMIADAIREHGADEFEVILLQRCLQSQMDDVEMELIERYNTIYPAGYNLARGGRYKCVTATERAELPVVPPPAPYVRPPQSRNTERSEETKKKIGEGIRNFIESNPEYSAKRSEKTKKQHLEKKLDTMMHMKVRMDDLESHLRHRSINGNPYIAITDDNGRKSKIVAFYNKNNNMEECKARALDFLRQLYERQQSTIQTQSEN